MSDRNICECCSNNVLDFPQVQCCSEPFPAEHFRVECIKFLTLDEGENVLAKVYAGVAEACYRHWPQYENHCPQCWTCNKQTPGIQLRVARPRCPKCGCVQWQTTCHECD